MREEWRPVKDYEGLYEVSSLGRIKSLERTVWDNRGYYRTVQERILKPQDNGYGYLQVTLCKDGKIKHCYIHKLVASAFIQFVPEANTSYEVDHRNTERTDNKVSNLCFVTSSQNNLNPKTRGRNINNPKRSKPVLAVSKVTGDELKFPSIWEAERQLGIFNSSIVSCCKGKRKSAGGFTWFYVNDDDVEQ